MSDPASTDPGADPGKSPAPGPGAEADPAAEIARLQRRLRRERRARVESEQLLMSKSRELYETNQRLTSLAESLQQQVGFKTLELLNAQRLARFGTLIWDIRAELITWSEGVYHVLGLEPDGDPLSFERYLSMVHPEDRASIAEYIQQSVDDMLELHREYVIEHRVLTNSGEVRWVRGYAEAVSKSDGEIEYVIGAIRDITSDKLAAMEAEENRSIIEARVRELEQTQQALSEARDEAQAASSTKSRFLAMMSHEIRTPMNGILGTLNMLGESNLDAAQTRLVRTALASGENLRTILNDILDLSKMEAGRLEMEEAPFSLVESIEDACSFWQPLVEQKGLAFHLHVDPAAPSRVKGDVARIRQILNNLISNALKFTERGEIDVRLSVDTMARGRREDARTSVVIEVQDTGVGISRADQRLLFREFSQLGENPRLGASGTGLGLAISRQLAELMDGAVGVSSAPGAGSCFWLRLPLEPVATAASDAPVRELQPLSSLLGRRPRVLLAEDVPTNQMIAEHMVAGFDCAVEIASNGLQALEALSERPFDIVLMDVSMPEMDGIEATRRIRARDDALASIPVVGVTAYALREDLDRFIAAGMDSCVAKPLVRSELHQAMARLLVPDAIVSTEGNTRDAEANDAPVVEPQVLEDLRRHLSADQVDELLQRLDADLRASLEQARSAAQAADTVALGRAGHAIKGLAGSLGAAPLAEAARVLEQHARAEDAGAAQGAFEALAPLVETTLAHFARVREGMMSA